MTPEQSCSFLYSLEEGLWKDFEIFHFYMAGRAQEPAGLQWESVDIENRRITVSDVAIWGYEKHFEYLKEIPKNGEERIVHLNDDMLKTLKRMKKTKEKSVKFKRPSDNSDLYFVFNIEVEPISYRQLQYRYNKGLKRAGLFPELAPHMS